MAINRSNIKLQVTRGNKMKQLKDVPEGNKGKGLSKLPTAVRNKMGFKKQGGSLTDDIKKIKKRKSKIKSNEGWKIYKRLRLST
jgi:hypothetical protein